MFVLAPAQQYVLALGNPTSMWADDLSELEEDLMCLLPPLGSIFDPGCAFHQHNRNQELGGKVGGMLLGCMARRRPSRRMAACWEPFKQAHATHQRMRVSDSSLCRSAAGAGGGGSGRGVAAVDRRAAAGGRGAGRGHRPGGGHGERAVLLADQPGQLLRAV